MRTQLLAFVIALAACHGNHDNADAMVDAGPPCDYTEAADGTNATMSETSNLTIGAQTRNLCGNVDPGHFDPSSQTVDVDAFRVTVDAASVDLVVRFFGGAGVENLADFSVTIFDTATNPTLLNGGRYHAALTDHGVFRSTLAAGTYDVVVTAKAAADLGAPIDYKVRIAVDEPCVAITMPAAYTESHDNADNLGNDVMQVDFSKTPAYTMGAGTAEPTGATIDTKTPVRLSGSSANVTGADQYMDRDTFELATDGTTNELSIRLDWTGDADLDYVVFAQGTTTEAGSSTFAGSTDEELTAIAVKPSTTYWLWVGGRKGSNALPAAYDVDVCGAAIMN